MKKLKILVCAFVALFSLTRVNAQSISSKDDILTAYYGVKNALITGNSSATGAKAKELLSALSSFPADQLTAGDKAAWLKYTGKLQSDVRDVAEGSDISRQREHFASLSENMYNLIKALKLNSAMVYKAYCPMKKSYWLSESAAIKNPYYGNQMLTCGEVQETLPAVK